MDRKISELTAQAAPPGASEIAINDAGTSKKTTLAQLLRAAPDGTAAAPGIAFLSDSDSGFALTAAGKLSAVVAGGKVLEIEDAAGTKKLGFFGVAPAARPAAYTPTNVVSDRTYDANATTVAELADVLGTLIADLQAYGLLQ